MKDMADAGWYYFNQGTKVHCASCLSVQDALKWRGLKQTGNIYMYFVVIHCCLHKTRGNTGNIPIDPPQKYPPPPARKEPEISEEVLYNEIQQCDHSRMAHYTTVQSRIESYKSWPPAMPVDTQLLAEAGFYYSGDLDLTKCFQSDLEIKKWSLNPDVWMVHAEYSPACSYMRLIKGSEYFRKLNILWKNQGCAIKRTQLPINYYISEAEIEENKTSNKKKL